MWEEVTARIPEDSRAGVCVAGAGSGHSEPPAPPHLMEAGQGRRDPVLGVWAPQAPSPWQVSFPRTGPALLSVPYLHGGLGNMWSELRFMKAAAPHDALSVPGDLWGCTALMVSVGLVSSPIHPGRCLRGRWVTSLPALDRKVWRGGGGGLTTQASLGGAALGSPGACCKQPVNPGDLQEAGTLPGPVGGGAQRHPGACAKATPPGCPAGCLCQVGWAGR